MLRQANVRKLHWADKTMSVLRQEQLESCERRISLLPGFGLFDLEDDLKVEQLWQSSYEAQEQPRLTRLHTVSGLRGELLGRLPAEAALLSAEEHILVDRLVTLGGEAALLDWQELSAAESLARRLWCTITREHDRIVVHLPRELATPLLMILSSRQHEEIRTRLMRHDGVVRALLHLGGLLHYEEPLRHLLDEVLADTYAADETLALRYLRTAYDYAYDSCGDLLLLHPGLADPEELLSHPLPKVDMAIELADDAMLGAMEGLMPEERPLFEQLYGLLSGATRPELTEEGAVEDLMILAKQGVSLQEMQEVLATLLTVQPTREMRQAVERMHSMTPRWVEMHTWQLQ